MTASPTSHNTAFARPSRPVPLSSKIIAQKKRGIPMIRQSGSARQAVWSPNLRGSVLPEPACTIIRQGRLIPPLSMSAFSPFPSGEGLYILKEAWNISRQPVRTSLVPAKPPWQKSHRGGRNRGTVITLYWEGPFHQAAPCRSA